VGTCFYVYGASVLHQLSKVIPLRTLELLYRYHLAVSFLLYVLGFVAFILTLQQGLYKYQFSQLTWTLMTLLIVVGQSHFIIQNIFKGLIWFLLPCSLIICNDIMAYFCGFALGKRWVKRPLTSLSPNKTWEGFVGALLCTLVFSFFFSSFLANYEWFTCPKEVSSSFDLAGWEVHCTPAPVFQPREYFVPIPLPALVVNFLRTAGAEDLGVRLTMKPIQLHGMLFALFASLISPFGGFFASGMKRAYGVKDFKQLFPGHGGMTDRMDCQFIMGLFAYVYHSTFINSSFLDVPHIIYSISHLSVEEKLAVFRYLNSTLSELVHCEFL